jgi:hypothetical protein
MIALDRREARRFCAAVRRCVAGRPRGLAPPIHLQQSKHSLTLATALDEVAIALRLPTHDSSTARLVTPWAMLNASAGNDQGVVTLEEGNAGCLLCRWMERGESKQFECPAVPQEWQRQALPLPQTMAAVDPSLLAALHACGQTAARSDNSQYALARVQLRGQSGDIVGTDGRQLLLWSGFAFPFADNVLVPAVPVFGCREFTTETDIRIGRSAQHVVVAAGPWTVWMTLDTTSRFPDVSTVLPGSSRLARMVIGATDATAILDTLAQVPASEENPAPVTLDFGPRALLRVDATPPVRAVEVELPTSRCWGPALRVALNHRYLTRALSVGLREVRASAPLAPILFRDERRSYVVAGLDPRATVVPDRTEPSPVADAASIRSLSQKGEQSMNPERNGCSPSEQVSADDILDPLAEAEALRTTLAEVGRRLSRLLVFLRQLQKQRRALQSAWSSLQQLHLGPKEGA